MSKEPLVEFIEARSKPGSIKLDMDAILGNTRSFYNKMDSIAAEIFTSLDMEETLEEIQGNYKLSQKEQVYTILAVKFRDMGLKTMMDSLFMYHIHNLKNKGIDIPSEPDEEERRYIQ